MTAAWLFAAVSAVFLAGCSPAPPDDEQHILSEIASFREMKDKGFAGPDSPVPPERREALLPLSYFPVSLDYRVPAVLHTSTDRQTIEMPTSTGQLRRWCAWGASSSRCVASSSAGTR